MALKFDRQQSRNSFLETGILLPNVKRTWFGMM